MTKEYIGSLDTRHHLTKYILNNGIEIILNDEEMEELFKGSKLGNEIEILKSENMKLAHQKNHYKDLIRTFTSTLNEMKGV